MKSVPLFRRYNLTNAEFSGVIPNAELAARYSAANGLVLPGADCVQGEALACGCPVIATRDYGAENLFSNGPEEFFVSIRGAAAILEKLERFALEPQLRDRMSEAALSRIEFLGGWDAYEMGLERLLNSIQSARKS